MSRRVKIWIVLAVVLAHAALFLFVGGMRALPQAHYVPPPATPNFFYRERVEVDPGTGERTIHRQIQVSTKLADPRLFESKAKP